MLYKKSCIKSINIYKRILPAEMKAEICHSLNLSTDLRYLKKIQVGKSIIKLYHNNNNNISYIVLVCHCNSSTRSKAEWIIN